MIKKIMSILICLMVIFPNIILVQAEPLTESYTAAEEEANYEMAKTVLKDYGSIIRVNARKYGIDPNLIAAIICNESNGIADIDSGAAMGLMQIEYSALGTTVYSTDLEGNYEELSFSIEDLKNPEINIKIGSAMLDTCLEFFDGNVAMAIQAYNFGIGATARTVGHYLSKGQNTQEEYCGKSYDEILEYARTNDDEWLESRKWYSEEGYSYYEMGKGTPDYLEKVLSYYDSKNGKRTPYMLRKITKEKVTL